MFLIITPSARLTHLEQPDEYQDPFVAIGSNDIEKRDSFRNPESRRISSFVIFSSTKRKMAKTPYLNGTIEIRERTDV